MWSGEERAARELCVKSVVVAGLGRAERSSPREEELGSGAGVASTKMLEFFTSDKDVHSKLVTIR